MDTEQHFVYIYFVVCALLALGIVGALVFVERIGFAKLLAYWAASVAFLAFACAFVMLKSCSCALTQILMLTCPCLLRVPNNGVITGEAVVFSLTVLMPIAAVLSMRRSARRR